MVVECRSSDRLFAQLSLDIDRRAVLACSQRLVMLVGPIYDHLHAVTQRSGREGDFIGCPFYEFDAVGHCRATTSFASTTVSAEENGMELFRTVRGTRGHDDSLSDHDEFESRQLT